MFRLMINRVRVLLLMVMLGAFAGPLVTSAHAYVDGYVTIYINGLQDGQPLPGRCYQTRTRTVESFLRQTCDAWDGSTDGVAKIESAWGGVSYEVWEYSDDSFSKITAHGVREPDANPTYWTFDRVTVDTTITSGPSGIVSST